MANPRRQSKAKRRHAREAQHDLRARYRKGDLPFQNGVGVLTIEDPYSGAARVDKAGNLDVTARLERRATTTARSRKAPRDGRRQRGRGLQSSRHYATTPSAGKLGRRSQNHLSPPSVRLRTAAAHRLDRRLPLNAARARQPVGSWNAVRAYSRLRHGRKARHALAPSSRRCCRGAPERGRMWQTHGAGPWPRCRRAGTNLRNRAGR